MKRTLILTAAVALGWLGLASASQAQVFVRAPFVRVGVGDGVYVRAPFVNLYVPPAGPVYAPGVVVVPPPPVVVPAPVQVVPPPAVVPAPAPIAPPPPVSSATATTLDSFARTFQPKAGTYDLTVINPVTNQPTTVRFSLPPGTPRRVIVNRDSVEFVYSLRQWVRIEFDRNGASVTARQ